MTATANKTAQDACAVIAQRALEAAGPAVSNPDGYLVATTKRIKANRFADALELAKADPDLSPQDLADMLQPDTASVMTGVTSLPSSPTPGVFSERQECSHCGCYGGGGWLAVERDDSGFTGRLQPCPTCAATRSDMAGRHVPTDKEADFERKYHEHLSRARQALQEAQEGR